jgi:nickel transport protein
MMRAGHCRTVTNPERTMNIKALLLGVSVAGFAGTLPAHDLWLTSAPSGTQLAATIFFGETNRRDLPVVQRLAYVDVIDDKGTVSLRNGSLTEQKANNSLLTAPFDRPGSNAVLAASYDNGYWLNTPEGSRNASRRLVPQGTNTRWVAKFAKTLMGPGAYTRVLGQELELVALEDPFTLAAGKTLRVRVQLRGKPVTDAKVRILDGVTVMDPKDAKSVPTDASGVAAVPLNRRGLFVLAVEYVTPAVAPGLADRDEFNSTLAFALN